MTIRQARWQRYYTRYQAKEQARGRAYYWAHRETILIKRREERAAEKKKKGDPMA